MNNIEKLGTVIKAKSPWYVDREDVWVFEGKYWRNQSERKISHTKLLTDITVLHEGYTPPMEEPGVGTVVRTKRGNVLQRHEDGNWYGILTTQFFWEEICKMGYDIIWFKEDSE